MLTIREDQTQRFEEVALLRFEDEMVAHSRGVAPALCEVLGEEGLRVALRGLMKKAAGHRFTNRGPIRLFIEMALMYGSSFDTDPQYPRVAELLRADEDQMKRARKLWAWVNDFQERTAAHQPADVRRSLEETLAVARKPTDFAPENFEAEMRKMLRHVFPQKMAFLGDEAIGRTIRATRSATQRFLPTPRGQGLAVILAFTFGHGCFQDPLYPWIERTIQDDRIVDAAARAERLEKKAVTWLEQVLSNAPT